MTNALLSRLDALAVSLARRDDALALLALGSVGRETARIDRWSDLDSFVLVREGAKPRFLDSLDWLAQVFALDRVLDLREHRVATAST